jgi:hypothetical protein
MSDFSAESHFMQTKSFMDYRGREKGVTPIANSIQDFETDLHRYVFQQMLNGSVQIAIIVFTKLIM